MCLGLSIIQRQKVSCYVYVSSLAFFHMHLHLLYTKKLKKKLKKIKRKGRTALDSVLLPVDLHLVRIPCEFSLSYTHMHRTTKNLKQTVMTSITKFTMNSCKPLPWFTHQHQFYLATKMHT